MIRYFPASTRSRDRSVFFVVLDGPEANVHQFLRGRRWRCLSFVSMLVFTRFSHEKITNFQVSQDLACFYRVLLFSWLFFKVIENQLHCVYLV